MEVETPNDATKPVTFLKFEKATIYKDARKMNACIQRVVNKMPNTFKHSTGSAISEVSILVLVNIGLAYQTKNVHTRYEYLSNLEQVILQTLMLLRTCKDLNIIPSEKYCETVELVMSVYDQMSRWKAKTLDKKFETQTVVAQ